MKRAANFFDNLEDRIRERLSRHPFQYALLGAIGTVLFWRGVWMIADVTPIIKDPYVSFFLSVIILLSTGLFVSFFVGDSIILSGLKKEKKLVEKASEELEREVSIVESIKTEVDRDESALIHISSELKEIRRILENINNRS